MALFPRASGILFAQLNALCGGTMMAVGKAMIFTSIIFVLGFGIDLLSSFEVTRNFGALVAFALVAAMLADLLLTPRLILATRVLEGRAGESRAAPR